MSTKTMDLSTVSNEEVRLTLQSVADSTVNNRVRRTMLRAIELLDDDGIHKAAGHLLEELAATKRAERQLLFAMPLVLLVAMVFLFNALRTLL